MASHSINADLCTNCGLCVRLCGSTVLRRGESCVEIVPQYAHNCLPCGHCVAVCPQGAIAVEGVSAADLPAGPLAAADDLLNLMHRRRSMRAYTDKPVPREMLERIVDAAASAPCCFPPSIIEVTVLGSREMAAPIAPEAKQQFVQMHKLMQSALGRLMVRLMAGKANYALLRDYLVPVVDGWIEKINAGDDSDCVTWDAPALLIFHADKTKFLGETDGMIASTHAMLAAEALGLGSIMLGFPAATIERSKKLRALYGIPSNNTILVTLGVGWSDVTFQRGLMRELKSVTWK